MRVYEKLGGKEIVWDFLISKGFKIEQLRCMQSRKRLSSKAIFCIVTHFKEIDFKQSDFYDMGER